MEQTRLDEIKARCDKATAGPWYTDGWALWDDDLGEFTELDDLNVDAQFIAHSREDTPELLAEVERLTNNVKEIGKECTRRHDEIAALKSERDVLGKALEIAGKKLRMTPDYLIQQAKEALDHEI